jgi:hypothetical protein
VRRGRSPKLWSLFNRNNFFFFFFFFFLSGIINKPFQELQEGATSYTRKLTALVAFLVRDRGNYDVLLPSEIAKSLSKLQACLIKRSSLKRLGRRIRSLIVLLWTTEWPPCIGNSVYDPTICFLALCSINDDGTFAEAARVTNPISAFEYCMRTIFLLEMHRRVKEREEESMTCACRNLVRWFTEKNESTFNTLRTLQHRATAIAMSSPGMPRVWWPEKEGFDVMAFDGNRLDLSQFPVMFIQMEEDLIKIWEKDLLRGLDILVTYTQLNDDLANRSNGYSFLSHHGNECFQNRDRLANGIMKDPELAARFLTGVRGHDGAPLWNILELRHWLLDYTAFHRILMTRIEMTAGSPSRFTEVSCLEHCNTKARQGRGLYAMGDYIAILCRYHKSQSITTVDKLIPHALDAFSASLVVQDLAIARPFAELAAHLCFPDRLDIQSNYRTYLFSDNGEPFNTDTLTKTMRIYTAQALGHGLGISDWRHVSVAFRRKHCPRLMDMVDQLDADTAPALQASHSMQTENRIYGLGELAAVLGGDRPLQNFLDSSTDWQDLCEIVPGGSILSYNDAITKIDRISRRKKQPSHQIDLSDVVLERIANSVVEKIYSTLSANDGPADILFALLFSRLEKMIAKSITSAIGKFLFIHLF